MHFHHSRHAYLPFIDTDRPEDSNKNLFKGEEADFLSMRIRFTKSNQNPGSLVLRFLF